MKFKSIIKSAVVLFVSCTMLSSCASGPEFNQKAIATDSKHSRVVVYRPGSFNGVVIGYPVMVDGRPIGKIYNHSYKSEILNPGRHVLSVKSNNGMLTRSFVVRPGQTDFFKFQLTHSYPAKDVAITAAGTVLLATTGFGFYSAGHFGSKLNQVPARLALREVQGSKRS